MDQPPPVVYPLVWEDAYDELFEAHCLGRDPTPLPSGNIFGAITPNSVLCLPDPGTYTISGFSPLRNVTIVAGPQTIVKVVAGSERRDDDGENDLGLRLIAGDIVLEPGAELRDRNQIIARGNVILNRGVTHATVKEVDEDGVTRELVYVKTSIKAGRDVVFAGSGTSGTYAEILANRKFCRNGNGGARFIGMITADAGPPVYESLLGSSDRCGENRAAIDFRGGGGWTASLPDGFDTDEPEVMRPLGISVIARRP